MKRSITRPMLLIMSTLINGIFSLESTAHHSFAAEFDVNKPINLHGTVIKVDWTNPHTYFYIEVENGDGSFAEWALEMGSPNGLMRRGWTRNTLEIGTEVMVKGTQARDGANKGNVQSVILAATCQRLFAGTSQDNFSEESASSIECTH
jgi:hypothetical protein